MKWMCAAGRRMGMAAVAGILVLFGTELTARAADAPAPAVAAAPTLPSAEVFFGPAEFGGFAISPSGRWLAAGVQPAGLRNGLAIYDLHGSEPPRELVRFSDIDIGSFHWVGEERLVFDLLDAQSGSADQRLGSGLFTVQRDGSKLNQLVLTRWWSNPGQGTRASRRLDATHRLINVPGEQTLGAESVIVHGARVPNTPSSDWVLKRLNIVSGEIEALNAAEPADIRRWFFDERGNPVLGVAQAEGQVLVYERGRDGAGALTRDWKLLSKAPALDVPWSPHSIDSAGRFYVTQPAGPRGESVLKRFDRSRAGPQAEAMVAVPGFDFNGGLIEEAHAGTDPLLGVRAMTEAATTVWMHPELAAVQKAVDSRLPGRTNLLYCRRCRETERTVVVSSSADRHPGEIWLWRGAPDAPSVWRRIATRRPNVAPGLMAEVAFTRIAARDAVEIPLWVTLPNRAEAAGPAPAVLLVHGGPWVRGGDWNWHPMQQFLASRGYVVLEPEFRGSTGFGSQHYRAGWKQWGRAMQDDLADAVAWAVQRGLVDPKRVCIAGASYGGYAALMGLVRQADVFRCAAAWVPLTDVRWLLREGSPDDWSDEVRSYMLPRLLADRDRDSDLLTQISPIEQVERIQAPLLLAWGEEDQRTPPEQAKALQKALRYAGREPEAVGYEGEGHGWLKAATRIDFARRLEAFLERSLRPAAATPKP